MILFLATRPSELVTRGEIQKAIWNGETFVDLERGLNFAIKKIRDTLGDDPKVPRYIETLPRRGYRFIAPMEALAPSPTPAGEQEKRVTEGVAAGLPRHAEGGGVKPPLRRRT